MNRYNLKAGLTRVQCQLKQMTFFVNEALKDMPDEFEFQVICPRNICIYIKAKTPNDAVEELRSLLNREFLDYPNGLYKIVIDNETVDALDYRRL